MTTVPSQYDPIARETFLPQIGKIVAMTDMTAKDRYFRIELEKPLGHKPGQFVMVSILGLGEAPIRITSYNVCYTKLLRTVVVRAYYSKQNTIYPAVFEDLSEYGKILTRNNFV